MTDPVSWPAPYYPFPIEARVDVPGSKSITNRALILAAQSDHRTRIDGALRSRDTGLMIGALRSLGTIVDIDSDSHGTEDVSIVVHPRTLHGGDVDCGLAGTVMRFVPPLAATAEGSVFFDGDAAARTRPQTVVLDALRTLGVRIDGDRLPFTVHGAGRPRGGSVEIDASASSQFVSGLLLSAARFREGVIVHHTGEPVPSRPHIDMTIDMLRAAGVEVTVEENRTWRVAPGPVQPGTITVEPDLSNATPFLAAAAVTGGTVTIPRWPAATTQPGDAIRSILTDMGCTVVHDAAGLHVTGPERLRGIDIDLHDVGELTPTVAAMAALADGPTHLWGIAHLRGHETDRLGALGSEINALGGNVEETDDGLVIRPVDLHPGLWHSYADHRMATAGCIIGLAVEGIDIEDVGTTAKTLPGFTTMWETMLADSTDTAVARRKAHP